MVIENRDAVVSGTKLVATYKKQAHVCTVEAGEDGKLAFVYDGKAYNSPSSAGTAVIGTACNGWRFWSIEGETPRATAPRTATKATTTPRASAKSASKSIREGRTRKAAATILHRHDNQADLSEGETRWLCNACLKSFIVFGNETPEACPDGHRADDPELSSAPSAEAIAAAKAEVTA